MCGDREVVGRAQAGRGRRVAHSQILAGQKKEAAEPLQKHFKKERLNRYRSIIKKQWLMRYDPIICSQPFWVKLALTQGSTLQQQRAAVAPSRQQQQPLQRGVQRSKDSPGSNRKKDKESEGGSHIMLWLPPWCPLSCFLWTLRQLHSRGGFNKAAARKQRPKAATEGSNKAAP